MNKEEVQLLVNLIGHKVVSVSTEASANAYREVREVRTPLTAKVIVMLDNSTQITFADGGEQYFEVKELNGHIVNFVKGKAVLPKPRQTRRIR